VQPIHAQVLETACVVAAHDWTFAVPDVIAALPHLNAATVRTHVASRCCANAPANHQTRYGYFRAIARGRYRVEPAFRRRQHVSRSSQDRILASIDGGADRTLIAAVLAMTPTARLETMRQAAVALDAMRR
jgi:hypothetical protein